MPRTSSPKPRQYCFTWNNPDEQTESYINNAVWNGAVKYLVVGREVGDSGTRHLQGFIQFKSPRSFQAIKRLLPLCHIEQAMGSGLQNFEYCSKDGDFWERGTRPVSKQDASRETWKNIMEAAKSGRTEWIEENHPRVWIQLSSRLLSLRETKGTLLEGDLEHEWWVGPTGTGKSRAAWSLYGGKHFQKEINKWWDGYANEDVVIIEEWSPDNKFTAQALKQWADRYPFTGQIKGGTLQKIRPKKVIVLSNYSIRSCFPDERDWAPLERRFTEIEFPNAELIAVQRALAFNAEHPAPPTPGEPMETTEPMEEDTSHDLTDVLPTDEEIRQQMEEIPLGDLWSDHANPSDLDRLFSAWL